MGKKMEYKRTRLLVDSRLQGKFMITVGLLIILLVIAQIAALYFFTSKELSGNIQQRLKEAKNTIDFIKNSLIWVGVTTMYRFCMTFDELKKGNLGVKIRFRDNDELQHVAEKYTETMDSITPPIIDARTASIQLEEELAKSDPSMENIKKYTETITSNLRKFYK